MSSKHPDHISLASYPIPRLLWMRHNHLNYLARFPKQRSWQIWRRWEAALLSAMLRQCRPVEVCADCGCRFDRHESYCPTEVAA